MPRERYAEEVEAMLETPVRIEVLAPSEPNPLFSPDVPEVENDAIARQWWSTYIGNYSHGLTVSDFPRWLHLDDCPMIALPAEAVRDPEQWDRCTRTVRARVEQWKDDLREGVVRIEGRAELTEESAVHLAYNKARLTVLEGLDDWNYPAYVERLLPGRKPDPLDLDNLRLYRVTNGLLIPVRPMREEVHVVFLKRLLEIWDGPPNTRPKILRAFLDLQHRKAPDPEVFLLLVEATIPRIQKLVEKGLKHGVVTRPNGGWTVVHNAKRWKPLVEKMEQWLKHSSAAEPVPMTKSNGKPKAESAVITPPPRTMAERLDAVPGARKAFDDMLKIDGFTNEAGQYVGPKRKGKSGILALWDAVVELFKVEGYGTNDALLSDALSAYMRGLTIDKRPSRFRDDQPYRLRLNEAKRYLKELQGKPIEAHSGQ